MNSQQLLYINLGIGLFFVLYFVFFRAKPRPPTRLNLRAKSSVESDDTPKTQQDVQKQEREAKVAQVLTALPTKEVAQIEKAVLEASLVTAPPVEAEIPVTIPPSIQKDPGIYFVYNAHEWECHDVLGIPRGGSLQVATEKYQQLIKTSDPSTFPFYEAAFDAILKRKGTR